MWEYSASDSAYSKSEEELGDVFKNILPNIHLFVLFQVKSDCFHMCVHGFHFHTTVYSSFTPLKLSAFTVSQGKQSKGTFCFGLFLDQLSATCQVQLILSIPSIGRDNYRKSSSMQAKLSCFQGEKALGDEKHVEKLLFKN